MPCSSGVDVSHCFVGHGDWSGFCAHAGPKLAEVNRAHRLNAALKAKRILTRVRIVLSAIVHRNGVILSMLSSRRRIKSSLVRSECAIEPPVATNARTALVDRFRS